MVCHTTIKENFKTKEGKMYDKYTTKSESWLESGCWNCVHRRLPAISKTGYYKCVLNDKVCPEQGIANHCPIKEGSKYASNR